MRTSLATFICLFFIPFFSFTQEVNHQHNSTYSFIENKGQWEENVLFKSKFDGGNLWVEQGRFLFQLQDFSDLHKNHGLSPDKIESWDAKERYLELLFWGSNDVNEITKSHSTKNYYNYFLGNDKSKWATNVHGYGEAILHEFYDGIDLKLIENEFELKYEFHVKPNIDPSIINMEYNGFENIKLDKKGNLIVRTELGEIIEQKPYVYQIVNGNVREVDSKYILEEGKLSYSLGEYNPNVELIIDPVLVFATYSGSPSDNFGMTATYGYDGTAYSGGIVFGNQYPTPAPSWNTTTTITNIMPVANDPAGTYGVTDVFISKYSADGVNMLWTCFLGGGNDSTGTETVHSLICDTLNNVYLYGSTSSPDFPFQNGFSNSHSGGNIPLNFTSNGVHHYTNGTDIYVSKLSSNGMSLLGSTYIGGSDNDGVSYNSITSMVDSLTTNYGDQFRGEIMLDGSNNVIVASCTRSTDFPVVNPFQLNNAGGQDGVVFKLTSDLSTLLWSSYYGGSNNDACYSVKVDNSGNVIFGGGTASNDLNGLTGWQNTYGGGKTDGFIVKLPSSGNSIIGGSYVGTSNYDQGFFVEVDRVNQIYMVGQSENGAFPVINSNYEDTGSSQFIIRFDSTLNTALNSTVFGSGNPALDISPSAFLVDICGNIYVCGWGKDLGSNLAATNMPITSDALQPGTTNPDFYLLVIERDFKDTLYASYIGGGQAGEHVDGGTSRFDEEGIVYQSVCGGCGGFEDFTTTPNAWSATNDASNCNNLIFKFDFEIIPEAEFTVDNNIGCLPFTVNFDNFSSASDSYIWDFGNGDTSSVIFEPTIIYDSVGVFQVNLYVIDSICLLTDTAELIITVYDSLQLSTDSIISICTPVPVDLIAYSNNSGNEFIWSTSSSFADTLNSNLSDSIYSVTPPGEITYYVQISNDGCSRIDSVQIEVTSSLLILTANDSICLGETSTIVATSQNPAITFSDFVWTPDSIQVSATTSNSIEVDPNLSQYVFVTATSNSGCVASDSILINVGNLDTTLISATASDYIVPVGGEVTLFAEPAGYSYQWSPSNLVNQPTLQQTLATVDQTTLFTLTVTDGICLKSDTVLVEALDFVCDESYLYVPNAFTPNGDGENDVLYVRGPAIYEMVFRVYDRLGELVFESFERPLGWDGTFRGKLMNPDVYDYYLKVTCVDQVETIVKGNFQLIR